MNTAQELAFDLQAEAARTGSMIASGLIRWYEDGVVHNVSLTELEAICDYLTAAIQERRGTPDYSREPF